MQNEKQKTEGRSVEQPPRDRMIRKPANTRDVLGRDPKLDVFVGGTGMVKHPTLNKLRD